jgi:hypothetical protein
MVAGEVVEAAAVAVERARLASAVPDATIASGSDDLPSGGSASGLIRAVPRAPVVPRAPPLRPGQAALAWR